MSAELKRIVNEMKKLKERAELNNNKELIWRKKSRRLSLKRN